MITCVLKNFYRGFAQNKGYFLINVLGLSICFTSVALIFTPIDYETGFDRGFENADNIYRVYPSINLSGNDFTSSMAPPLTRDVQGRIISNVYNRGDSATVSLQDLPGIYLVELLGHRGATTLGGS